MTVAPASVAMSIPFALDDSGAVAIEQVPVTQLSERVSALASTQPGQRVMAARFGVDSAHLLFGVSELSLQALRVQLIDAMKLYEPGAMLTSIAPVASASGTGIAAIRASAVPASGQVGVPSTTRVVIRADGTVVTSS